jgi:hypothetical protein
MSGDFICDLSGIAYCMYEGVARPDATQNGTIDLRFAHQAIEKFL